MRVVTAAVFAAILAIAASLDGARADSGPAFFPTPPPNLTYKTMKGDADRLLYRHEGWGRQYQDERRGDRNVPGWQHDDPLPRMSRIRSRHPNYGASRFVSNGARRDQRGFAAEGEPRLALSRRGDGPPPNGAEGSTTRPSRQP